MVNIGVVGLGYWGPNLLRNFDVIPECHIKFCCDTDVTSLKKIQQLYPYQQTTSEYSSLLKDPEIEAIIVATPAKTHYSLVKLALQHDKHVFVEKPLTLDSDHATELIEISQQRNLTLMVGHLMEYHPAIEKLKELIQSGNLGDIYYIYSQRVNLGKIRKDENVLWSLAPHDFSLAMFLLDDKPLNVSARGEAYIQEGIDDIVFTNLQFSGGIMMHAQFSWLDPHKIRQMTIVGSQKMAVFNDMNPTEMIRIYDKGIENNKNGYDLFTRFPTLRFGDVKIPHIQMEEPLRRECQHFIDCLVNHKQPRSDGFDGLRVVQILQAAQESRNRNGEPVKIQYIEAEETTVGK